MDNGFSELVQVLHEWFQITKRQQLLSIYISISDLRETQIYL